MAGAISDHVLHHFYFTVGAQWTVVDLPGVSRLMTVSLP
jgi:hypothetical protein